MRMAKRGQKGDNVEIIGRAMIIEKTVVEEVEETEEVATDSIEEAVEEKEEIEKNKVEKNQFTSTNKQEKLQIIKLPPSIGLCRKNKVTFSLTFRAIFESRGRKKRIIARQL